jgi:hypothetical protein
MRKKFALIVLNLNFYKSRGKLNQNSTNRSIKKIIKLLNLITVESEGRETARVQWSLFRSLTDARHKVENFIRFI